MSGVAISPSGGSDFSDFSVASPSSGPPAQPAIPEIASVARNFRLRMVRGRAAADISRLAQIRSKPPNTPRFPQVVKIPRIPNMSATGIAPLLSALTVSHTVTAIQTTTPATAGRYFVRSRFEYKIGHQSVSSTSCISGVRAVERALLGDTGLLRGQGKGRERTENRRCPRVMRSDR